MDEQVLKNEIMTLDDQVKAVVVNSPESYENAGTVVASLESLKKKITAYWKDPIAKAFDAHRALTEKRNEMLKPVDEKIKSLRKKISEYLTAVERKKREEQARLAREAAEKEAKEKAKLEKKAERAEENGNTAKAAAIREQAENVFVPMNIASSEVEKTTRTEDATISAKKDIEIVITEPLEIIKGIASGKIPISVVDISVSKLKKYVKDYQLKQLDGCIINEIVTAAIRAK